jgi:hypothetical protein
MTTYQSIQIDAPTLKIPAHFTTTNKETDETLSTVDKLSNTVKKSLLPSLVFSVSFMVTYVMCFVVFGDIFFPSSGPNLSGSGGNMGRRLLDVDPSTNTPTSADDCTPIDRVKGTAAGAGAGAAITAGLVFVGLLAIGLSPAGPIAGSWFAASQGAALASGGFMAGLQSVAMTGAATAGGAYVGGAAGGVTGAYFSCPT